MTKEIIRAEAERGWRDARIAEVFASMVLEDQIGAGGFCPMALTG